MEIKKGNKNAVGKRIMETKNRGVDCGEPMPQVFR